MFPSWVICSKAAQTSVTKRNLLVFVTPTIIDQRYGTGLEEQVSGVHHTGEEFADPNGWRNNAKGGFAWCRRQTASWPRIMPSPECLRHPETTSEVQFKSSAKDRDF